MIDQSDILAIALTYNALAIAIIFRAKLVGRVRMKAIEIIANDPLLESDEAHFYENGFFSMVFDLSKWTFKQFYPNLAKKLEEK